MQKYNNISNIAGDTHIPSWKLDARVKQAKDQAKIQKKMEDRPGWNNNPENEHKLSHAELLQRKLNAKSKNEALARAELQQKMDALKAGKIPKPYKKIIDEKSKKNFTSKEAFIKNKELAEEYKNRSYVSKEIHADFAPPAQGLKLSRVQSAKRPKTSKSNQDLQFLSSEVVLTKAKQTQFKISPQKQNSSDQDDSHVQHFLFDQQEHSLPDDNVDLAINILNESENSFLKNTRQKQECGKYQSEFMKELEKQN